MSGGAGLQERASEAVRACLQQPRAAAADAYLKETQVRRWARPGGAPPVSVTRESGFAVRVLRADGRCGHAWAAGPGEAPEWSAVAATAARLADRCSPGAAAFPPGRWDPPDLDLFDTAVEQPGTVAALLDRLERAVREEGSDEVRLDSLECVAGVSETALATSAGFAAAFRSTLVRVVMTLRVEIGGERRFDRPVLAARHVSALDADRLGREAARRARLLLATGQVPPGPLAVALEPRAACVVLEHLATALRGEEVPAASGERVGSRALTLVDDAALARGLASMPFDGAARPTARRLLLESGEARPWPGGRGGRPGETSGTMLRTSYADPPRPGLANLHVAPGDHGPGRLLAGAGTVFRVALASLAGHGAGLDGEVILSAAGELFRDGAPVSAARGAVLAASGRDILAGVRGAGNDLAFHLRAGSFGSPTLLVDGFRAM